MKKQKRILLTGDDGYNAIGTRLLIHFLKDTFDLRVAGTGSQQSGVGGKITIGSPIHYHTGAVDGVPALWVDSGPADAVECASSYFKDPFDYIISGINFGANISGGSLVSSGTVSAAMCGVGIALAPKALAISWDTPPSLWRKEHREEDTLEEYLEYPGRAAYFIISKCLDNNLWGAEILNINLPRTFSPTIVFTIPIPNAKLYYQDHVEFDESKGECHIVLDPKASQHIDPKYDSGAILCGYNSISPFQAGFLNQDIYQKMKKTTLTIQH